MITNPGDGIYETKSFPSCQIWPEDRRVYIQGSVVKLVDYRASVMTEEQQAELHRLGYDLFDFGWFFKVNILGPRVGDLPPDFNIRKRVS